MRVPLSGTIAFDVAPGGILSGVAFDITGGEGEIALPEVFPAPVPVRRLAAAGSVDGELSRLVLDTFVVDTDRPSFYLDGTLWQTEAGIGLKGRFQAHDLPFDSLGDYWPEGFIEPGRQWIGQNVADGVISQFEAVLDLAPGDFENDRFSAASGTGTLVFEDATIHYLRPMPPVEGVDGTGRFTGDALDLTMSGGHIEGIVASRGTALLSQIHSDEPRISVTIEAEGPAADALALLDHPRLGLVSKIGLEPVGVGGTAHTLFALDLPLLLAIEPEQVEVNAVARVDDARIADIAGIAAMTEGVLRLGVDNASMDLRGTARLQDMPATIAWRENFGDGAPFARRFDVTTTVTPKAQAALGFDMAPYVQGTLGLVGGYTDPGDGAAPRATLAFDATGAQLEIPELHWTKPAGTPGAVRVVASVPSEDTVVLTRIELETETLYALGRATLASGLEGVREITIETLRYGETEIAGRVVSDADATSVSVRGASFDARPYFSRLTDEGAPEFGELVLDLAVERIVTTDDQQLTDFRARFETDPRRAIRRSHGGNALYWCRHVILPGAAGGETPDHRALARRRCGGPHLRHLRQRRGRRARDEGGRARRPAGGAGQGHREDRGLPRDQRADAGAAADHRDADRHPRRAAGQGDPLLALRDAVHPRRSGAHDPGCADLGLYRRRECRGDGRSRNGPGGHERHDRAGLYVQHPDRCHPRAGGAADRRGGRGAVRGDLRGRRDTTAEPDIKVNPLSVLAPNFLRELFSTDD